MNCDLWNYGLGSKSASNISSYKSRRNATTTMFPEAYLDPVKDLITESIQICAVDNFIEFYSGFKDYKNIVIKSDTDGNCITIFNEFMNNHLSQKISCYVLEIFLIYNFYDQKIIFYKNLHKFSNWVFTTREKQVVTNK